MAKHKKTRVKHIIQESSWDHVISYYGGKNPDGSKWAERVCSEPDCEINEGNMHVGDRK
jgi:hypothetical protein